MSNWLVNFYDAVREEEEEGGVLSWCIGLINMSDRADRYREILLTNCATRAPIRLMATFFFFFLHESSKNTQREVLETAGDHLIISGGVAAA